jgi:hypothetical protein
MCEDNDAPEAPHEEAAPLSNVSRLRSHLQADGLAVRLLDAWVAAEPAAAQAMLLRTVDDHFNVKKDDDGASASKD